MEKIVEFHQTMTEELEDVVQLKTIANLSKLVGEEVDGYHHCDY